MDILYLPKVEKEEKFVFRVNQGGELDIRVSNGSCREVSIIFKNDKFQMVDTSQIQGDFIGTRSYWYVMAAIADEISRIESSLMNQAAPKQ